MTAKSPEFFQSCASPVDLMRAAHVEPASPAIECLLDAACGAEPTRQQRQIFGEMSSQSWPSKAPKRVVLCAGRGSTKTTAAAWLSVFHALCVPHDEHAAAGTRIYCASIAPTRKQSSEALRITKTVLDSLRELGVRYEIAGERSDNVEIIIVAPKRRCERVISIWSQEAASPRGFAFCFLHALEFGHWKSGVDYKETDIQTLQAVVPRMAQFPQSQAIFESTPGAPSGLFHQYVTQPPADTLVARGSTFFFNPRISEKEARAWVPDEREFKQEILAKSWGYGGDGFLDPLACERCLDHAGDYTGKGPRSGAFVCGVDLAQVHDASAWAVVSCAERVIDVAKSPVRYFACEHLEEQQGTKVRPLELEQLKSHTIEIARAYPNPYGTPCSVLFDIHLAVELKAKLRERGFTEVAELHELRSSQRMFQAPVSAAAQTARWRLLRELVHGGRLKIPPTPVGRKLVDQLQGLRAWELPGGLLKVEGVRDDLADACVLALEAAVHLPPNDMGNIVVSYSPVYWLDSPGNIQGGTAIYTDALTGLPCEPPYDTSPGSRFEQWAEEMCASGHSTPSIERWKRETGRDANGLLPIGKGL